MSERNRGRVSRPNLYFKNGAVRTVFCGFCTKPLLQYLTAYLFNICRLINGSVMQLCKALQVSLLDSTMAEQEVAEPSKRRQVRLPPSVPFLWEERPGVAKKDWKPETSAVKTVVTPTVKLIASVPFSWEEKPGKPLSFSQPQNETFLLTPLQLITSPTPQTCFLGYENGNYGNDDGSSSDHSESKLGPLDLELESFRFGTYDSFSSAPSLPANSLVPFGKISSAVPEQKTLFIDAIDQSDDISSPDSDTDSSTSSYATVVSSLAGTEFLECLFPLYSQNSGLCQTNRDSNKAIVIPPAQSSGDSYHEQNSSVILRRPHTLGELIMMSRRRSCQRKADCKIDRSSWVGKVLAVSSLEQAREWLKDC